MQELGDRAIAATLVAIIALALLGLGVGLRRRGEITLKWEAGVGTALGICVALTGGQGDGAAEGAIGFVIGFLVGFDATFLVRVGASGVKALWHARVMS